MNIVLTGFMCTGKTSVGLELSKRLNMKYIDTDEEIEKFTNKKIVKIFEEDGESYFRDVESRIVSFVSKKDNCVISTGGGVVLRKENMDNLRLKGKIINLTASAETILKRLKSQPGIRPLLNKPEPLNEIINLMKQREQFYKNCDLEINTDNLTIEEVVSKIMNFLNLNS